MRVLLDEQLDRRFKRFFGEEHEVVTVRERGWGSKGERRAHRGRPMRVRRAGNDGPGDTPEQQNLTGVDLVILLLEARSNRLADLAPLVEGAEAALSKASPGEVVRVTAP